MAGIPLNSYREALFTMETSAMECNLTVLGLLVFKPVRRFARLTKKVVSVASSFSAIST